MENKYRIVAFNKQTESIELRLPDNFNERYHEIINALIEEFGFEPVTSELLLKMEEFVRKTFNIASAE